MAKTSQEKIMKKLTWQIFKYRNFFYLKNVLQKYVKIIYYNDFFCYEITVVFFYKNFILKF